MFEQLKQKPANGIPPTYVAIHHGIGGWNSAVWGWEPDDGVEGGGYYQPLTSGNTNTIGGGSREEAVQEAMFWAQAEELPLWLQETPANTPESIKE